MSIHSSVDINVLNYSEDIDMRAKTVIIALDASVTISVSSLVLPPETTSPAWQGKFPAVWYMREKTTQEDFIGSLTEIF